MIHIVFGAAAASSLKQALREMKQDQAEEVITFDDIYSIGPIFQLHERDGLKKRTEWLQHVKSNEFGGFDDMVISQEKALQQMKKIKGGAHILIWIGNNAHEQIGMRYAIYLLKEKHIEVSIINTTIAFDQLFNTKTSRMDIRHAGEIITEKLKVLYKSTEYVHTLSVQERETLEEEWLALAKEDHTLRIWRRKQTMSVSEDEFDAYLVKMAKRLHQSCQEEEYMVTPRLIGEVLGYLEQYIGDEFIEYRIKRLIDQGVFDKKGNLSSMRFYSIKLTPFGQRFKKWICCQEFEAHPFVQIEGTYGIEPFQCGHCHCHLEREDVPLSDALFLDIRNWSIQYGRWFDEETEDRVEMEQKFNREGEYITRKVKRTLPSEYQIEYIPSNMTQYL